MKAVVNWFCDPSLHVLLLGMVLLYCAMGSLAEESIEAASEPITCACYTQVDQSPAPTFSVAAKTRNDQRP